MHFSPFFFIKFRENIMCTFYQMMIGLSIVDIALKPLFNKTLISRSLDKNEQTFVDCVELNSSVHGIFDGKCASRHPHLTRPSIFPIHSRFRCFSHDSIVKSLYTLLKNPCEILSAFFKAC